MSEAALFSLCVDPNCPNLKEFSKLHEIITGLEREVHALRSEHKNDGRCTRYPKGERCALPAGHAGGCKWASGD